MGESEEKEKEKEESEEERGEEERGKRRKRRRGERTNERRREEEGEEEAAASADRVSSTQIPTDFILPVLLPSLSLSLETFHIPPSFTFTSNLLVGLPGFDRSVIKVVNYRSSQLTRMSGAPVGKDVSGR